jgi:two-component system, sensor histidine kinase and response regulator
MTRILAIEDSATQAAALELELEAAGFSVQGARNAEEGLQALEQQRFDVVISDIVMPGLSGFELCRRVKSDARWADLPVILLTTLSDPEDIVRALECGADNFVTKVRGSEHLLERLRLLVETRRLRSEAGAGGGVRTSFQGKAIEITASREQILDLLLTTFEDAVRANGELELSRTELEAKHQALVELQRQKDELSALLVHDLRSPAAGIVMQATARLRSRNLPDAERQYWSSVMTAADTIQRMSLNLLDITRAEEGSLPLKLQETEIRALLEDVGTGMAALAAGREQQIVTDVQFAGSVSLDRELIRRVLNNLADNASRHSPIGGTIRIVVARDDESLLLSVCDEGPGVPDELKQRVFDKYMRLGGQSESSGRGLGLAFCQLAVEAHGGSIWVEDNQPSGSRFCIRLPLSHGGSAFDSAIRRSPA